MEGTYVGLLLLFVFFFGILDLLCAIGFIFLVRNTLQGYPVTDRINRGMCWFVSIAGMYVFTLIVYHLMTQPL